MGRFRLGFWSLGVLCLCGVASAQNEAQGVLPPPAAAGRVYTLAAEDGRRLGVPANGAIVQLSEPYGEATPISGFAIEPLNSAHLQLRHGDLVRVRSADGRWLARFGVVVYLSANERLAVAWHLERVAGEGALALGDRFRIRSQSHHAYLSAGPASAMLSRTATPATTWTIGCYFAAGPFTEPRPTLPSFQVVTGEHASRVARAIDWLRAKTVDVELPSGRLPLVVWDDPTLAPEPSVGYLVIDTLWAAKALQPYEPDLASQMENALRSIGWYGNGLAETLFHGYLEPAHRTTSVDFVHGTLLDRCVTSTSEAAGAHAVQVRVPEQVVDPAWTQGNSAQFVDSAVYTALNDHWNGRTEPARDRLRELIVRSGPDDPMFWDIELGVIVDQASRCDYDAFVGQCSPRCAACVTCTENCFYYNATYKLGLVVYAARVTGLASDSTLAPYLAQMVYRVWEGQLTDGGLPHTTWYASPGVYILSSGATGEATAITVLANTVQPIAQE